MSTGTVGFLLFFRLERMVMDVSCRAFFELGPEFSKCCLITDLGFSQFERRLEGKLLILTDLLENSSSSIVFLVSSWDLMDVIVFETREILSFSLKEDFAWDNSDRCTDRLFLRSAISFS